VKKVALVVAVALAVPTTATAKGPNSATIAGPGLADPITFSGHGEPGGVSPFSRLVETSGLFAVFSSNWGTLTEERPAGELGPRYTLTHVFADPGGDAQIRQDVYPYATPSPLVYTEPKQRFFNGRTSGGWYEATGELTQVLVDAGLPRTAPRTDGRRFDLASPVVVGPALAAALGLVAAAALVLRRRTVATR
jgi:hypothetical protein